jgi:sulfate adenylyltransferase subunit 1 (EFTu-like GTPase family)
MMSDIAQGSIGLSQPAFFDACAWNDATGALILRAEATNHTVAAGIIGG